MLHNVLSYQGLSLAAAIIPVLSLVGCDTGVIKTEPVHCPHLIWNTPAASAYLGSFLTALSG